MTFSPKGKSFHWVRSQVSIARLARVTARCTAVPPQSPVPAGLGAPVLRQQDVKTGAAAGFLRMTSQSPGAPPQFRPPAHVPTQGSKELEGGRRASLHSLLF